MFTWLINGKSDKVLNDSHCEASFLARINSRTFIYRQHLLLVKHLLLVRHLCKTKHTNPIESKSSTHYTCSVLSSDERRIQTIWQRLGSRRIVSYLKLHHSMKSFLGKTG